MAAVPVTPFIWTYLVWIISWKERKRGRNHLPSDFIRFYIYGFRVSSVIKSGSSQFCVKCVRYFIYFVKCPDFSVEHSDILEMKMWNEQINWWCKSKSTGGSSGKVKVLRFEDLIKFWLMSAEVKSPRSKMSELFL